MGSNGYSRFYRNQTPSLHSGGARISRRLKPRGLEGSAGRQAGAPPSDKGLPVLMGTPVMEQCLAAAARTASARAYEGVGSADSLRSGPVDPLRKSLLASGPSFPFPTWVLRLLKKLTVKVNRTSLAARR